MRDSVDDDEHGDWYIDSVKLCVHLRNFNSFLK